MSLAQAEMLHSEASSLVVFLRPLRAAHMATQVNKLSSSLHTACHNSLSMAIPMHNNLRTVSPNNLNMDNLRTERRREATKRLSKGTRDRDSKVSRE